MKIGLVSSAVPLVRGGYRFIVDWLADELRRREHDVEIIYIPTTEDFDTLLPQMAALRTMEFSDAFDRVITFRPPAHVIRHPRKVAWFIHHIRTLYDLWDTPYRQAPDNAYYRGLREAVITADTVALDEAYRVFTNSEVVSARLQHYNGISSEVLYPPVHAPERFRSGDYGDEIVCVCRMEHHKRQHLLIEAMGLTRSDVRLRLCGLNYGGAYVAELREKAAILGVEDRVLFEHRWVDEDHKVKVLENALAAAYVPLDEDAYGYPTIEAAHAKRCTITVSDSGGVREFVQDGINGLVARADPAHLASMFDSLHADRTLARRLGEAASERVSTLGIDWDTVIAKLLA